MSPIPSTRSLLPVDRRTARSTALGGSPTGSSLLLRGRTVGRARLPVVLVGVVVAGWAALMAAQATGWAGLVHLGHQVALGGAGHGHSAHHEALGAGSAGAALVAFVAVWELMIVAMMLPTALPMIGLHGTAAAAHDRPAAARGAFAAGYVAVWTAAGIVAFAGAAGLHRLVGATPGLAERPWLVAGALLVVAGAAQFLPLTQACLRACRHPYPGCSRGSARAWAPRSGWGVTTASTAWAAAGR